MATGALNGAAQQGARQGGRPIAESLSEYGRGLAGGLIFSLPLLFTQEVWQLAEIMPPTRLGVALAVTVLLLLGYNRYAGLRSDASWAEVLIDSVEELGLGLVVAALLLWLIGVLDADLRPGAMLSVVLVEGLLAAIGVSVGTAQLGGEGDAGLEGEAPEQGPGVIGHVALSGCGAVLIAANVAPTEEMLQIGGNLDAPRLLGLMALGLAITAVICFYSDFVGTHRPERPGFVDMAQEIIVSYAVALVTAAGLLWFFGRLDGLAPLSAVAVVVVVSVPAALGASAGRLLLKGGK